MNTTLKAIYVVVALVMSYYLIQHHQIENICPENSQISDQIERIA